MAFGPPNGLRPGDVIDGKYRVERELGRGGHAVVYGVEHLRLGRPAALKVLQSTHPSLQDRFLREARSAALLDHPRVVKVTDFGVWNGHAYLVMEWVDGETLADRLGRGRLEPAEALRVTLQVLEAVDHAHSNHMLHRDLKPQNVMLSGQLEVKIVDFGLAKWHAQIDPSRLTDTGDLFGTPGYMSPEQATSEAVDARADLYAVGVLMYEMLVGKPAFEGRTVYEVLEQQVVTEVPEIPDDVEARYPGLREAVARATHSNVDERYPSAVAFASELARVEAAAFDREVAGAGEASAARAQVSPAPAEEPAPPGPGSVSQRSWVAVAVGIVLGVASAVGVWWLAS